MDSTKRPPEQPWTTWIASPRTGALLLAIALVEVLAGLLIRLDAGQWEARRLVFGNWLGGMPLLASLGIVHLAVQLSITWRSGRRDAGALVARLGGVALLASVVAGSGCARTTLVEIESGQAVASGAVPGRWELALEGGDGSGLQEPTTIPLGGISEGTRLALGYVATATVVGWQKNGVIGVDAYPIALPRGNPAWPGFPAIALDLVREGAPASRVALDGNRPVAELGRGLRLVLRRVARPLPFELELVGAAVAGASGGIVRVAGSDSIPRSRWIDLRRPLHVRGADVFLAASRVDERSRVVHAILHVVENPFRNPSWWCMLLVLAGLAWRFMLRTPSLPRRAVFVVAVLGAVALGRIGGAMPPWIPTGMPWGFLLVLGAAVLAHLDLERLRAGRFDATRPSAADPLLWGLIATSAEIVVRGWIGEATGTGEEGWGVASLPLLLWGALLLAARGRGWIGVRGVSLGVIASLVLVPVSVDGPALLVAGLPRGGMAAWTLAACLALEVVFLWWVLLSERCHRCARAARLWRIRYVRSRNPRLRRHGGD